jgi:nucleoside 2-deoxyribosyltransferase
VAHREFNNRLKTLVENHGFEVYLPQEAFPPDYIPSAEEILETNIAAVENCDIILSVLDCPGLGVAFEIGYAMAKNRRMIAFRSDLRTYLGKIIEGFWDNLDSKSKAQTLDQLSAVLKVQKNTE